MANNLCFVLRYILFHHQTTTPFRRFSACDCCVISSFITKPQHYLGVTVPKKSCVISSFITKPQLKQIRIYSYYCCVISSFITKPQLYAMTHDQKTSCVISSFITKPQLSGAAGSLLGGCVISSFITKPQLRLNMSEYLGRCVISSFITKPQLSISFNKRSNVALYPLSSPNHNDGTPRGDTFKVALYPLSSPNHNLSLESITLMQVALYPLSSPNHNLSLLSLAFFLLRYILFHHQTTTADKYRWSSSRCVISSFITKPQLAKSVEESQSRCVISSFITKPQPGIVSSDGRVVALYPLSSPNHNFFCPSLFCQRLRYILFHHQTTTSIIHKRLRYGCVISSFITKPQPVFLMCCNIIQLQGVYSTGNGMVSSLSRAKLLKKLKLHRLLLYFLFYLSPYIDDVGVLFVGYRDYTKSSLAGHEEFYSLDVYIP